MGDEEFDLAKQLEKLGLDGEVFTGYVEVGLCVSESLEVRESESWMLCLRV
jgi:hypothetical protein